MNMYKSTPSRKSGFRTLQRTFHRTMLAQAVAAALITLAVPFAPSALAANICSAGPNIINTVQLNTDNCVLGAGDSLSVVAPGSITPVAGGVNGVEVTDVAGAISNSGTISGARGININGVNFSVTSITNSGTISGFFNGILVQGSSSVVGSIINSGTISATSVGAFSIFSVGNVVGSIEIVGPNAQFLGHVATSGTTPLNIQTGARLLSGSNFNVVGFNNAGTFAVPAGATSTITGNYTQQAGGVFETILTDAATFGRLVVTGIGFGIADLSASNALLVNVVGAPVLVAGTVLPGAISADTLIAGPAFTITDNSALFNFTGAVVGNAINLTIVSAASTGGAVAAVTASGMTSGLGAATTFDALIALGAGAPAGFTPVITALGALPDNPAVASAVLQTLPFSDSATQATLTNLHGVNGIVLARSASGGATNKQGLSSGDGFASSFSNRGAWVKPLGSWADQKDRSGAFGYDASTYGIVVGADGDLSKNYRLGAALAYTRSSVDSNSGLQSADIDSYGVTLYGTHELDGAANGMELNWQVDYAHHQNEGRRRITFVNQTASSDYNSNSIHLGIGVARSMVTGVFGPKTIFTPSLRADYTRIRDDGYTETGAGALNLVVNGRSTDELIVAVDGKLSHALDAATTLNANLGVGYDTQAKQSSVTSAFQGGGAAFATTGINPPKTLIRGGLGLVINTKDALEITARYDVEARKDFTNQTASIKFKMPF